MTLRFLLTVLGLVVLSEVVTDDAVVVSPLNDLLTTLGADTNETTPDDLGGRVGRQVFLAHEGSLRWRARGKEDGE